MMDRRCLLLFTFILMIISLSLPAGFAGAQEDDLLKHPRNMNFPPLLFNPPQADRHVLSNGMVVYLLEDRELPLIQVSALIRTGSMYDPPAQSGLAHLTATVLRTGGTEEQSPRQINETLEFLAAELEFSMDRDAGRGYLSVLQKDFPRGLSIFAGLLMKPAFDRAQIELAKQRKIEAIRRSNDHPEDIAYREFRKALFQGNPRGQVPTIASVEAITRADLLAFYKKFFHPNNIILGVSGDFRTDDMLKSLEEAFVGWNRSLVELPVVPLPVAREKSAIYYAPKDLSQATILQGHLSPPLDHPDHIPFKVLNFILGGGGFNSRLMREIRSNRGLAYSVGSFYQPWVGYGVFGAFCQTKSATVHKAITLINEITEALKKSPPTPEELDWAKNSLINQFIFSFSSSASVVGQQMQLEYDGLSPDSLKLYRGKVAAVTLTDLERVANKYLRADQSVLLVVGKEENFEEPLSSLGAVHRLELTKFP